MSVGALQLSCAADRRFVRHTAAMLHSVLTRNGALAVNVHFLHGPGLPRRTRARLAQMVERLGGAIQFLEVADERVRGLGTSEGVTQAMWYRIYLPELLPDTERVLYLDGDTLALDSLAPLWETHMGDHLVAAVTNVFVRDPVVRALPAELGLGRLDAYFNSGVLLLNLEEMRVDGTTAKLRDFALSRRLMFPDQDALNAVMGARRLPLHPRWNCMNSIMTFPWADEVFPAREVEEARRRPGIRHFEGGSINKPWHLGCNYPQRDLYFEHRRGTPWPRVRLEGRTAGERVRGARGRLRERLR